LNNVYLKTRLKTLSLAGGVALNCAANGKILERTPFEQVFVQPAAHDAGTSIGAALHVHHQVLGEPRSFIMRHVYYGPDYDEAAFKSCLAERSVQYHRLNESELIDRTARQIAQGSVVGWFQGRMEFGPRALGNRSILADPRRLGMKDVLNSRIKYREPFRPFCPSVLAESVSEFFELSHPSPFMVMAYKIKPTQRDRIPAVTHMDGTGRLQTVEKDINPLYWNLIRRFGDLTGVPVLLNTSFNENEPIVNTPEEAIDCFLRTQMDVLVLGQFMMFKAENGHQGETMTRTRVAAE
jgi:carbamoyltransferase